MKIKPAKAPPGRHESRGSGLPLTWLKEWLENQGKYVELSCGHMIDLNDRSVAHCMHPTLPMVDCEVHRSWQKIERKVTFHEFAGIRVNPIPDEPLF